MTNSYNIVTTKGKASYQEDDTRNWVEQTRVNNLLKPNFLLRVATDTNYIYNRLINLPAYGTEKVYTKSIMNIALPGMRVPNVLNWQVQEQLDNEVSTGSFEIINAMLLSNVTTTLAGTLSANRHSTTINTSYAQNSLFTTTPIKGNVDIRTVIDVIRDMPYPANDVIIKFREDKLVCRQFEHQTFAVTDSASFPNPAIRKDADNDIPDDPFFIEAEGFQSASGIGSYYVLIGNEVVRVTKKSGNTFSIPPGGRAVNGILEPHSAGDKVTLLNMGPLTGDVVSLGCFSVDPYAPQRSLFRAGAALVSYEGYGEFPSTLSHYYDEGRNYQFTGYWFVDSVEDSLGEDGVPRLKVNVQGPGALLNKQQITTDLVQRAKNTFGEWNAPKEMPSVKSQTTATATISSTGSTISVTTTNGFKTSGKINVGGKEVTYTGKTSTSFTGCTGSSASVPSGNLVYQINPFEKVFSNADHTRDIPGDWVDYDSWDPTIKGAYPLQIKTEYAQHKAYFDHMQETTKGKECIQCRKEKSEWEKTNREKKGNTSNAYKLNRAIGRHIYKQSIRVIREEGGPIKTYIRLMNTLAMAAWDNPPQGLELGQRFTKIPNTLFDNMRNINTGLIFNGQPYFLLSKDRELEAPTSKFDWSSPGYSEYAVVNSKKDITCPFESSYDKSPFSQPAKDLADVNGASFWINREGYPIMVPANFKLRAFGTGYRNLAKTVPYTEEQSTGEWFLSYGGSINAYTKNIDPNNIVTQMRVSVETAFDEGTFTIAAAGTGIDKKGLPIFYGGLAGNKEGLALTGGVQQVDTMALENLKLGLDWNTNPASWGVQEDRDGDLTVLQKRPALFKGVPTLSIQWFKNKYDDDLSKKRKQDIKGPVKTVQRTINFFLSRQLIQPHGFKPKNKNDNDDDNNKAKRVWVYLLKVDGVYGEKTEYFVQAMSKYVKSELQNYNSTKDPGDPAATIPTNGQWNPDGADGKKYSRYTYKVLNQYFTFFKDFLINDPVWWVQTDRTWTEYVAHIVGLPVAMNKAKKGKGSNQKDSKEGVDVKWTIDNKETQKNIEKWMKQFNQHAVVAGARKVDASIEKSITKNISTNIADPRIQPGDVIWSKVPGLEKEVDDRAFVGEEVVDRAVRKYPHTSGLYVTSVSRQIDLTSGSYTATYSGHRYKGIHGAAFISPDLGGNSYLT